MAGAPHDPVMLVAQGQVVGTRALEGQGKTTGACSQLALAGGLVFHPHPTVAAGQDVLALLAGVLVGVAELHLVAHRAEALRGAEAEARGATLDEDFLGGLDSIGRAVTGEHGKHVAAGLVRRRQVEAGTALGVGGQLGAGQFHRELAHVLQLVVHHRQLLGPQAQLQARIGHRLAIGIEQHQVALHRLAGLEVRLGQAQGDLEVRLDVFSHAKGAAVDLVLVAQAQLITARHRILR